MDNKFSNPGSRIKKIAIIYFKIMLVLTVLAAIAVLVAILANMYHPNFFEVIVSLILGSVVIAIGAAVFLLMSYLAALAIYAFGELVESNTRSAYANEKIAERLSKMQTMEPEQESKHVPAATIKPIHAPAEEVKPAPVMPSYLKISPMASSNASAIDNALQSKAEASQETVASKPHRPKSLLEIPAEERTIRQILEYAMLYSTDDGLRSQLEFQTRCGITPGNQEICDWLLKLPNAQIRGEIQKYLEALED